MAKTIQQLRGEAITKGYQEKLTKEEWEILRTSGALSDPAINSAFQRYYGVNNPTPVTPVTPVTPPVSGGGGGKGGSGLRIATSVTHTKVGADGKSFTYHPVFNASGQEVGFVRNLNPDGTTRTTSEMESDVNAQNYTYTGTPVTTTGGGTTTGVGVAKPLGSNPPVTNKPPVIPPPTGPVPITPPTGGWGPPPVVPPVVPPVDPMQKLRDAMTEARKLIPTRESVTGQAQKEVDPLANMARATLQQDVARKTSEDQKAMARQLAARGRIGGPATEALKGQLTSQANSALTQGLSQVESTRIQEINRLVSQEVDRASTFADKQFTAAAGLIAMGANADNVIKEMGINFQNDLSKIAIQNRFVAEQAATDRTFREKLQTMSQDFEKMMAQWKMDEAGKQQNLGFLGQIFNTIGSVASFYLNPLSALSRGGK